MWAEPERPREARREIGRLDLNAESPGADVGKTEPAEGIRCRGRNSAAITAEQGDVQIGEAVLIGVYGGHVGRVRNGEVPPHQAGDGSGRWCGHTSRTSSQHGECVGTDAGQAHLHGSARSQRRTAFECPMRSRDDPACGERHRRLACRERIRAGRVEPVVHGLADGVHDTDVGIQLKDLRKDQRRGGDAEDDR